MAEQRLDYRVKDYEDFKKEEDENFSFKGSVP